MTAAQAAQQNNRGPGGQYSFGTHAEPDGLAIEATGAPLTRVHGQRTFTVEAGKEPGSYSIFETGNEVAYFGVAPGAVLTPDELWKEAKEELDGSGVTESRSECGEPVDDGEGYDGLCGSCADEQDCADDDSISEFVEQHRDAEVTVIREDYMDDDIYEIRDGQGDEILSFSHPGDPEDHACIWESAQRELKNHERNFQITNYSHVPAGSEMIIGPQVFAYAGGKPLVGVRYKHGDRESIMVTGEHGAVELWQVELEDAAHRPPLEQHRGGLEVHSAAPNFTGQSRRQLCPNLHNEQFFPDGST